MEFGNSVSIQYLVNWICILNSLIAEFPSVQRSIPVQLECCCLRYFIILAWFVASIFAFAKQNKTKQNKLTR